MGWSGGERPAEGRWAVGRPREEQLRESQAAAAPPGLPRGQESGRGAREKRRVARTAHEVLGWPGRRRSRGRGHGSKSKRHCQHVAPALRCIGAKRSPILTYEIGGGRGAAAAATGNSGIAQARGNGRDAGTAAQPTAIARGARSGSLGGHRQSLLPHLLLVRKGLVRELGSGKKKRSSLPRNGPRGQKVPTRGGVGAGGSRKERRGAGKEVRQERCGWWCEEGATMTTARGGRSDDGANCLAHKGVTSTQWRNKTNTTHKTKTRQPFPRPSLLTTHVKRTKEFECQEGLYQIDQLDSSGLDAPPRVSDRGVAGGNRIRSAQEWTRNFFTERSRDGTKSRSGGGLDGCGAAKSRSHRLSLALLWQLAESRWSMLSRDHDRR